MMLKHFYNSLFTPTRNTIDRTSYVLLRELLSDCRNILNVGSASHTILGSKFWSIVPSSARLTTLDINPKSGADIICDVCHIPSDNNNFDLVVCQASVEHFEDIDSAINEIKRVTTVGGYIYFTVPFLQGYHADPYDFRRYTNQGFINVVNLPCLHFGTSSGPFSVISWILRDIFTFGHSGSLIYKSTRFISSLSFVLISYLDYIFPRTSGYSRNACEYFYLFRNH